ncbi:MAG: hypothetical protein LBS09_04540 [Bacteroidales bacterium]|jgi:hypothetical protein|nr:hypothetical protein [Bacteroidales bacterium]
MLYLIVVVIVALSFAGLGIGIWVKGKFPDTHVEHNPEMKKLGITCAKNEDLFCRAPKGVCAKADTANDAEYCRNCCIRGFHAEPE